MEAYKWGQRIRAYRKLKGYTQVGLAKAIGVSVSVLGEVERGNRTPTEQLLLKIASELDVSIAELTPKE